MTSVSFPVLRIQERVTENDNFQVKELFNRVRVHGSPNFFGTHIPLNTQLNVGKWEEF